MLKKGRGTWNKGLTKETDERVNRTSQKLKGKKFTEEHKIKLRKQKSEENRKKCLENLKIVNGKQDINCIKKRVASIRKGYSEGRLINPFKGKHTSEEAKRKGVETRIRNGSYIVKEETKNKIKERLKIKENHPMFGKHQTEEAKQKIGKSNKGKHPTEETKNKLKEARKNRIFPFKDTKIEIKIQNFLTELNIPFLKHQYMEIEHAYQCDILIPSMNLVIEIDGDWWHGNPKIFPNPNEMQLEQIEEDKIRTQELIEKGFKVLRLWECDIEIMELNKFKGALDG